jgi:uncharacterized hydrophobic protein (TIGR00271 family)
LQTRIERHVPQLGRDARVALFEHLDGGSRPSFDFMSLIALSTAIASLGLCQNSAAVVIGAMLVAPLMTPMIGSGLALVQGNAVLLRSAASAIVAGFFIALAIGFTFGATLPVYALTPELLARGAPNLLDLLVAGFSGVAAAYATARPNLSGALPGVAIAAALVPPIATVGVSLALKEAANARGAALLFGTNLVAIVLGATLCLRVLGVMGPKGPRLWRRRVMFGLASAAGLLILPLGSVLFSAVSEQLPTRATVARPLREALTKALTASGATLVRAERPKGESGQHVQLDVEVESRVPLSDADLAGLAQAARTVLKTSVVVRVRTSLVSLASSVTSLPEVAVPPGAREPLPEGGAATPPSGN